MENDNIALSGQWLVGSLFRSLRKPPTSHRRQALYVIPA